MSDARWSLTTMAAMSASVLAWAGSLVASPQPLQVFLDNLGWSIAMLWSAWACWTARNAATGTSQAVLQGVFQGAALLALGQMVWNLQVAVGWNPFPAPADALFLLAGPVWALSLLRAVRQHLPADRVWPLALDFGGAVLALLALTLVIYVPGGAIPSVWAGAVLVAYPVSMLTAAFVAALALVASGVRLTPSHLLVCLGLLGYGLSWMRWNLLTIENAIVPGMPFNLSFSVCGLMLGWGALGLRFEPDPDPRYRRRCERALSWVPLASMGMAAVTLGLLMLQVPRRGLLGVLVFAACMGVLLLAALRQVLVLRLSDRMREAEAAVLRNEEQLYRLAHYDALTGLPNRRSLEDALQRAVADAERVPEGSERSERRVALLFIDLDHFDQVNETYGTAVGDALLVEAAQRLQRSVPEGALLARLANDQFLLLLERVRTKTAVAQCATVVSDVLAQPWSVGGHTVQYLGASTGISLWPDDAQDATELMRHALAAMNATKSASRGTYRFYREEFTQFTRDRLALRQRLRDAMAHRELSLVYQPQVDREGRAVGVEALLRWCPDGKPVGPDVFVPMAEEMGLIPAIGLWVFEQACQQWAQWRDQGLRPPVVSINVSTLQMREPGFVQALRERAAQAGVPPQQLVLEITESQLLDESLYAMADALRQAGFQLSIDDFGTGHSSLIKLRRLPVSELKIDRLFVQELETAAHDREICSTIHALAHALGLAVVAEGVETESQLHLLLAMGCERFQGWYFAPALPPAALACDWLGAAGGGEASPEPSPEPMSERGASSQAH
ncbi:MAG: putative bifunctional diguanylate cyclase/phosphodiesterase [Burkholderiaceae bacterium]